MLVASTVLDFLDQHQGSSSALLTAALVLVTCYYAWQNRRMVAEMARTRELAVLPKLSIEFLRLGPAAMDVAIKNVGPGPAIAIDVRLAFEARNGVPGRSEERRWRQNILAPGEQKDFLPPGDLNANLDTLPERFQRIRLIGTMRDATGKTHAIDEVFDDLPEWREVLGGARQRFVGLPERELAQAFEKRFETPLRDLNRHLGEISRALNRAVPSPDPWGDMGHDTSAAGAPQAEAPLNQNRKAGALRRVIRRIAARRRASGSARGR
ncbi:MAG: hypothetical protein ACJ768_21110 [Gaiellaceae bacterium]